MTHLICAITVCTSVLTAAPSTRPAAEPRSESMYGKVYVGYQGWFIPGDEGDRAWIHYSPGGPFRPGHCNIDLWPDVSELSPDERVATPFRHADGRVAEVFSSDNPKTVDRHFTWMKQYGIDGVFLQRFGTVVRDVPIRAVFDVVLGNVRRSAARADREWAIMYDLTGMQAGEIRSVIMPDWKRFVSQDGVRNDRTYMHHRGRPVVGVWGIGFSDGRKYTIAECRELVNFLQNDPEFGHNAVLIGVPFWWRSLERDAVADPALLAIAETADIVSPWAVGRHGNAGAVKEHQDVVKGDLAWAGQHKRDYMPVVFPGFSWYNMMKAHGRSDRAIFDQIPRRKGQFLWSQATSVRQAGARMCYVAMFDEMDEGTAIFKISNDPPTGENRFVTYEGLPADHYLWLTGQIGRLMQGQIDPSSAMPSRQRQPQ